jgi:GNAT superfamily N-acetyltransferase
MQGHAVEIVRITEGKLWHALADDEVVGRGYAAHRSDGHLVISVDSRQHAVFHRLAAAILADLPRPLYTLVDEADEDQLTSWECTGFTPHRRERQYVLPTDPDQTGLGRFRPPPDLTILPVGQAEEDPLRELDRVVRAEVDPMLLPAQVLPYPSGATVVDPSRYAVAVREGQYVGLARVLPLPRRPRLGLIAVHADHRRHGVARALLADILGGLHQAGTATVSTEVAELNAPAVNLFESIGAKPSGGSVELVHR